MRAIYIHVLIIMCVYMCVVVSCMVYGLCA